MIHKRFPLQSWLQMLRKRPVNPTVVADAQDRVWANLQANLPHSKPMKSYSFSPLLLGGALAVLVIGAAVLTPYYLQSTGGPAATGSALAEAINLRIKKADGSTVTATIDESTVKNTPGGTFGYLKKEPVAVNRTGFIATAQAASAGYDAVTFYEKDSNIFSYNLATREQKQLTQASGITTFSAPQFSSPSQLLAAVVHRTADEDGHAVLLDPKTGELRFETDRAAEFVPNKWSPDGSQLLMTAYDNQKIRYAVLNVAAKRVLPLDLSATKIDSNAWTDPIIRWDGNEALTVVTFQIKPGMQPDQAAYANGLSGYLDITRYRFDLATEQVTESTLIPSAAAECLAGEAVVDAHFVLNKDREMVLCNPETGEVLATLPNTKDTGLFTFGIESNKVKKILVEYQAPDGELPMRYAVLDGTSYKVISEFTIPKGGVVGTLFPIGNSDYALANISIYPEPVLVNLLTGQIEKL